GGGGGTRSEREEGRPRRRRAVDCSRDGGERTIVRALPREAVIAHQHLIGSPLPFAKQPGSGLQLGASTYPHRSAFFELLGKLAELALSLWAQTAESHLLHPVCDGSQQQLTAEARRWLGFVESAPVLTKLAEIEPREARERLPASRGSADRAAHARSGPAMR